MEQIAISKFKATCLAILENVRQSGQPVLVTRFGKPVAEIVPPRSQELPRRQLGRMAGTGRITGDIISPAADEADWDALK
ncbi:MAG TPA: type II toxin-antitoxin system prevent-host-death family antitoxin [Terriglobales bacterium]|nr:type II toxin-antitoxin system prevent-host-death family antitoxin [Terriglobales bacterium]